MALNNEITDAYCSFEVSKLLNKKGFNCECKYSYAYSLKAKKDKQDGYSGPFGWEKGELNIDSSWNINSMLTSNKHWYTCSRPTHYVATTWIRKNFGFDIRTGMTVDGTGWSWAIYNYGKSPKADHMTFPQNGEMYAEPEEAMEGALLLTLKELL